MKVFKKINDLLLKFNIYQKEDDEKINNILNSILDDIGFSDKVILIKGDSDVGFTIGYSTREILIFCCKQLNKYDDFELMYSLGHELAHHEFRTIGFSKNSFLYKDNRRIEKIIDELFCDIRGRQIAKLTDDEIDTYFNKNNTRLHLPSDGIGSWKHGYFTSQVRSKLVNKHYKNFNDNTLDIQEFAEDIKCEHNKVCKGGKEISDIDIIINGINNNLRYVEN